MTINKPARMADQIGAGTPKLTAVQEEVKHSAIHRHLVNLGSAIDDMEDLIANIAGEPTSATQGKDGANPALAEFLNTAPKQIAALEDRLRKGTERLRELLF